MAKTLTETCFQESTLKVDASAGILRGVKVLGENSRNGRRYTAEAMKKAVPLYDGLKTYVDHPNRESVGDDRRFRDWSGQLRNPRYVEGQGIFADQHLRTKGEYFEGIIEAATKFPNAVGYSHVADGETRLDGDTEIVESIREVFSVDLVTDPATTAGFFESHKRPAKRKQTIKSAVESMPEGSQRKMLLEMIDSGYIDGDMSVPEEKTPPDPLAQMSTLAERLITMLGETLKALAMKKDTPPPAAPNATDPNANPQKDNGVGGPPSEGGDDAEKKEGEVAQFESLKRENAELKAKTLLLESGRKPTPARVKALAAATEADAKELLESWPCEESSERPDRSPPLFESGDADFDFSKPGSFASRYN